MTARLAYTIAEAAEACGVSPDLMGKLARNGTLTAVKLGSKWVIPAIELERHLGISRDEERRQADVRTLAAEFARLAGLDVADREAS